MSLERAHLNNPAEPSAPFHVRSDLSAIALAKAEATQRKQLKKTLRGVQRFPVRDLFRERYDILRMTVMQFFH